ncbi:unnamed protein product [Spirodela intermedia]|uniref:Uncharacterized protein n=1 Tax=Spirodela intermedia TaxID=51605 RepID=A0A7I8JG15_SPIIN|nr:unnamed protein product [Spirodela intermedia]CAA6669094.1 unnamed protein product [Spirodela intermedia]
MENQPQKSSVPQEEVERKLKHLEFFHLAAIQVVVCLLRLYGFAKENSGPLKPGVQAVEGTVMTVVGPVYDRFHDVPYEILRFIDRKVDESMSGLERFVPTTVKNVSTQAYTAAQKAPEVARSIAGDVQRAGVLPTATALAKDVVARCEPTAKKLYATYEPVAEHYAVAAWHTLNRLPLFPQVAQVVVPTVAHWTDKYNAAVTYAAENGYAAAAYLPHVPTERISKIYCSSAGGEATAAAAR